jgi:raffinose/stachyose/melibiose transport system substrate-binding protein
MWSYLATRICGQAKFLAAANRTGGSFDDPCFVQAGTDLKQLIDLQPFEPGFLGMSHDQMQGTFGNGKAAMELSGQWAPGSEAGQAADKKGVANLGLFNFPAVAGGAGDVTDVMGGGNGFAIGKNAPPEAVDFVKFLTSVDVAKQIASTGTGIPPVVGADAGLTDPNMITVQKTFTAAKYFQLYYDQYMPSAMGGILNDAVAKLYAGTETADQVAKEVEAGAVTTFGK